MRSRTELVTTTFIDSEEEQTESDDSEEDWRPVSSRNGKKRSSKGRRRNKRKAGTTPKLMAKKKMFEDCGSRDGHGDSDDGDYRNLCQPITTDMHRSSVDQKSIGMIKSEEKQSPDKSGVFNLYLYKKDLDQDYKNNSHLCLWRRDGSSLLQKYIRVKTSNCEEFIFTSSSVYSSWDERRRKDFATIDVKCMEDNKRRVTILEPGIIQILSEEMSGRNHVKTETDDKVDEDSSNEMLDSQDEEDEEEEEEEEEEGEEDDEEEGDYEDDEGEEEVSGDDDDDDDVDGDVDNAKAAAAVVIDVDVNSAKTSEEAKGNESYEAVKESNTTDKGTSQPSIA